MTMPVRFGLRSATSVALTAAMAAASPAPAQSVGEDAEWILESIGFIWSAPARTGSADLLPIGGVLAASAGAFLVDAAVADWVRRNPDAAPARALRPFGEHSPLTFLGYTVTLQALSAAMYGLGHAVDSANLREAGIGCSASNLATTTTRMTIAIAAGRVRPSSSRNPFVFDPLAFSDWERQSFFGGHAANIMSCASFWNHRFDLGAAGPVLYALAGAIGGARIIDEAHWLSDTILGLAYGYAIGKGIAARSRSRFRDIEAAADPVIRLGWQIRF